MQPEKYGDKRIIAYLRPILRRIRLQHYLLWLLRGSAGAMLFSALLLLLSFFIPWPGVKQFCWCSLGAGLFLAGLWAWGRRPDLWDAALASDAKGLQERVTTAWECSAEDSAIIRRQRRDALGQLEALDYRTAFPLTFPVKEGKILALSLILLGLLCALPNPQQMEVDRAIAIKEELLRQEKKIEAVKKEIEAKKELIPREELEQAIASLEELQKDWQGTTDMKKALKSLAMAEEKLEELRRENLQPEKSSTGLESLKLGEERPASSGKGSPGKDNRRDNPLASGDKGEDKANAGEKSDTASKGNNAESKPSESVGRGDSASQAGGNALPQQEGKTAALAELNRALRAVQDSRQALLAAGSLSPSQWASASDGDAANAASGSSGNNAAKNNPGNSSSASPGGAGGLAPDSCGSGNAAGAGT